MPEVELEGSPDLAIEIGSLPASCEDPPNSCRDAPGQELSVVAHRLSGGACRLDYHDGTRVVVSNDGTRIWSVPAPGVEMDDACLHLMGQPLGLALRHQGLPCLHASAVAIDGVAIALMGPSGAGKSSTAAAFAKKGFAVLADDVTALREAQGGFRVQPSLPRVRLWSDSVEALFGTPDALPRLIPNWEKCYLPLGDETFRFHPEPLDLACVYVIEPRERREKTGFEAMDRRQALMALVADSFGAVWLDAAGRAAEFQALASLAARVPVRRIRPREDIGRIPDLSEAILADWRSARETRP
jgi:hypothetical protein